MNTELKEHKFTAGSRSGSSCKRKQMRESLLKLVFKQVLHV